MSVHPCCMPNNRHTQPRKPPLTWAERELERTSQIPPGWSWSRDPAATFQGRMQSPITLDQKILKREGN